MLAVVRQELRAWPWWCDHLGHINNARYLDIAQNGRIEWLANVGILRELMRGRYTFLVTGVSGLYRREIPRLSEFTLETQLVGFDARFILFTQTFALSHAPDGPIAARFLCRAQLRDRREGAAKGALDTRELLSKLGVRVPPQPELPADARAWVLSQDAALAEVRQRDGAAQAR